MNERKRIIIQTGANPDESLSTPHFDAEATLTARPVVPLSEQDAYQKQYGGYAGHARKPFWKRPALLALIVLVAAGVGVAAGLAIGFYKNRNAAPTPVVSAPSSTDEKAGVSQPAEQPAPTPTRQARATVPENPVETAPPEPKAEERERPARNERKSDDNEVIPPVVRDKKRDKASDDDESVVLDEKQAERERRRDERRERRRRQRDEEQAVEVPRQVERVERGVNRIREIFEGRQP
jgi:type IV secretory pathway VirB10-like protein